jgi:hypothetical protein
MGSHKVRRWAERGKKRGLGSACGERAVRKRLVHIRFKTCGGILRIGLEIMETGREAVG